MFPVLVSRWKDFLLRTFDIRTGESKRAWFMQLNIFLLIQCLWIIKPVVNAQFLSRVGIQKLPLVFLLVALTALAFSKPYSKLLHSLSLDKMMTRTYAVSIVSLLGFGLLLNFHFFPAWLSFVFYIEVALFGLITTSQFWLQANLVFSSLEAKRLFGFIGAGAIAGGISGGYITTLLTHFFDSIYMLFVAAALLLLNISLNYRIWKDFYPEIYRSKQNRSTNSLQQSPLHVFRNSNHLTYLALILGISVLVAKLVEFQFSAIAAKHIQDPEKLTAFFGFWFSTANALSFGIQLLLTQRIVSFLGVGRSLFILPVGLIASTAAVLKAPVLWAGTTLKVMEISLKQSINKAATELLILPVPMAVKSQAKTYIDVFVDTTATGIGGLMLILLINGLGFSVRALSVVILFLVGVWVFFALRARKEYIRAFEKQLGLSLNPTAKKEVLLSDADMAKKLRRTLHSGTAEQIIILLENIEESKNYLLMKDVIPLLEHESPKVRLTALSTLYYYPDHSITKDIVPLLKDPNEQVRARAFACLLSHTRFDRVRFINDYMHHEDPSIRGAALVGLATETRDNLKMQKQFSLEQRLRDYLSFADDLQHPEAEVSKKINVIRAIGFGKIKTFYPLLLEWMKDENHTIAQAACRAAGNTGDLQFIRPLLFFLSNETMLITVQKALAKFNQDDLITALKEVIHEKQISFSQLIHLPALSKSMDVLPAIDFLMELLSAHHHPELKLEALEVLHEMKTKFPDLRITVKRILPHLVQEAELYKNTLALNYAARQMLKNDSASPVESKARNELIALLEKKLNHDMKRIFWLIGLSFPSGIILPLYKDLRHQDPNIRISTVELLDNLLDPGLKKVVKYIIESALLEKLSADDLNRFEINIPSEFSCYKTILNGQDEELKVAAINLLHSLKNPEFSSLLRDSVGVIT